MNIHLEEIDKLAALAKLEFTAAEKQGILTDLENITSFFAQIAALDTENIEPIVYLNKEPNRLRPDKTRALTLHAEALLNAPANDGVFFIVPKVITGK